MSYTINEIKVAAYNFTELPDMSVEERALWYSIGYWYEEYRANPDRKAECQEAVDGYVDVFLRSQLRQFRMGESETK